ncbi:unnamed protein product [Fraxinus pennsylvanica]|uniref:TATA-box-binding protein n=1 Tax=Fraxinus pennsylvanica TaxID=56036 RepID=A0AAD2E4A7_9LAMI|nr:unnamed protein product [Fraxinus pennsylvanica]
MADPQGLEGSQPVDISKHPSGIVPTLQNIVSTVNLDCKLDLKAIALQARNAEYNPKRFAAVIMRIREPKTTALIFASGKMVCTGAKSEQQSKLAARKYARIIQKLGFAAKFKDFKIQNIVGSCDVKFPIRLEGLAYAHGAFSSYEPELLFSQEQRSETRHILHLRIYTRFSLSSVKSSNDLLRRLMSYLNDCVESTCVAFVGMGYNL